MLGIQRSDWHGGVGPHGIICRNVFGPQFQPALPAVGGVSKTVDFETQIRQYLVVDNVVQKHGIRVEGFLRQNDAIIK